MGSRTLAIVAGTAFAVLSLGAARAQQKPADGTAAQAAVINTYCVSCHSDKAKTGGLSLENADLANLSKSAETWEKVVRKIKVGMMPPPGMARPDKAVLDGFASYVENSIDRSAAANPKPGRPAMHRLNRSEYANVIRDLLDLDIDAETLLPADDESNGFDNNADVLRVPPSLLERYLSASWNISRAAVGNPALSPAATVYRVRPDLSQDTHLDGLPLGTKGGTILQHTFPVDAEYTIKVRLWRNTFDLMRGMDAPHSIEIAMDGERLTLVTVGGQDDFNAMASNPGTFGADLDKRLSVRIPVKAGVHSIWATTILKSNARRDDLIKPFIRTTIDGLDIVGDPAVDRVTVEGPYGPATAGDTPSRRKIFTCKPTNAANAEAEAACAKKILTSLARMAFRRSIDNATSETLMRFYQEGRANKAGFEQGVEAALQFILTNPEFLYRFEPDAAGAAAKAVSPVGDIAMASRLSFFIWSSIPDNELLTAAEQGKLNDAAAIEKQVKRMLADPKSKALISNFAEQWLYLRNLKSANPDLQIFPDFDDNLRQAMKEETTLLFDSIMREDRSVMTLLDADYTFVNERLARHYGIPNIYGSQFRKVKAPENRRGLLGQGSILTITSYPNRTSAVQRGKWILTNLLGVPPTPPPPNVPALKENGEDTKPLSLRERMEKHRVDPVCSGCHKPMDPLGFALENFDGTGYWRTLDDGNAIDPSTTIFNGSKVDGLAGLRQNLTSRPDVFVGVMTEKMLTYALGRGIDTADMPAVRKIVQDARANNYKFSSIVLGIAKSTPFQFKEAK